MRARKKKKKATPIFFSSYQEQPKIIEPLDYEAVVFQRKAQIHNDPHRDLLLCPVDDVSVSTFVRSSCFGIKGPTYSLNNKGTSLTVNFCGVIFWFLVCVVPGCGQESQISRQRRTVVPSAPQNAEQEARSLFAKEVASWLINISST